MDAPIEHLPADPDDDEIGDTWARAVSDEVHGVEVVRMLEDGEPGEWQVGLSAAEYVRDEPLESRFRAAVVAAITGVPGVEHVYESDREIWGVVGEPAGEALARAVADAVDAMADELRAYIDALE